MKTFLSALFILLVALGGNAAPAADHGFTLYEFQEMEMRAPEDLDLVLQGMYQTAVYAQAAIEHPTICFTPVPLSGATLRRMIAAELADPDDALDRSYTGDDHVALVLVNALRAENVCR
jgi:hypothetical protein